MRLGDGRESSAAPSRVVNTDRPITDPPAPFNTERYTPAVPLLPGTRLGPYEIVELVGMGGMGEVYRAVDTRLERHVAVKVLSTLSKDSPDHRQRFEREARAVSSLTHPHICALYDIGQQDGVDFLVMEYLEGETLAARLARGPLPLEDVLRYGVEIAEGLDEAHRHGVVHRDLKPGNVMLTRSGAKLLDFGLAKWVPRPKGLLDESIGGQSTPLRDLTAEGALLGTLPYMAPEQLQGRQTDARTDLFALGSMLYEMVSGRRAFGADSTAGLISAILTHEPPLASDVPPSMPQGLQHIVRRCLAKDPEQRWQTAHDLAAELTWFRQTGDPGAVAGSRGLAPGGARLRSRFDLLRRRRTFAVAALCLAAAGALAALQLSGLLSGRGGEEHSGRAAIESLAVLPLANVSGDPNEAYFVDGMTDALITGLSRMGISKVISRTSVMSYRGTRKQLPQIGRELNVDAIVEGSVWRAADRVRISAQLIDAATDEHLWADAYERDLRDVFALQAEVTGAITQGIRGRLAPDDQRRLPVTRVADPRAYDLYLKGRYSWNQYTEEGWNTAIAFFNRAIAIDPNYSPAWAGLADSYYQLSSLVLPPDEAIPKARAAALTALKIDDKVAEAHASLGVIKAQYDWDRTGAERDFKRAIELDPNYATAHQWLGMHYFAGARFADALASFERARQLDPLSLIISVTAVWPLVNLGRYDQAIQQVEEIIEMHPEVADLKAYLHDLRGEVHLRDRRYDEAVTEMLQGYWTRTLCGDSNEVRAAIKRAYALSGMMGYWQKQLELAKKKYSVDVALARKRSPPRYVSPYRIAELHARVGGKDQAFVVLEQCVRNRDESLRWLKAESLKNNSPWEGIRSDPRFADLLRRIGLAA
jgi:serine/threonine protein kinase/TolB-like protein